MNTTDERKKHLLEELKDKEYRDAYVSSMVDVGVAFQIKALREHKPWTQEEMANQAHMKQPRIHELEDPSKSPNLKTLKRLANAFDVGLIVRFVPISELVKYELALSSEYHMMKLPSNSAGILSYKEEPYFSEPPAEVPSTIGIGGDKVVIDMFGRANGVSSVRKLGNMSELCGQAVPSGPPQWRMIR